MMDNVPKGSSMWHRGGWRLCAGAALLGGVGVAVAGEAEPGAGFRAPELSGWAQFGGAYTYASPSHLSQFRGRAELAGKGSLGDGVKWKLSARAGYDAAYDLTDFYPSAVRSDQRLELVLREAYLDFSAGDWEFRLGKQSIVWGEMVGLFFADVVSAKDLREFILPEFEQIRIPQWAARAEWFKGDTHLELVWLPVPTMNNIGVPGAEYYSYPLRYEGLGYAIDSDKNPSRTLSNSGFGVRLSTLVKGWDLATFVYRAPDAQPSFYRTLLDGSAPTVSYQPRHYRVTRVGGTLAKDFEGLVAKAEVIYTAGRQFSLTTLDTSDGLVPLNTLEWVAGLDFTPAERWRVNTQLFERTFLQYDPAIGQKRHEPGASLLVARTLSPSLEAEVLGISSLVRSDWMLRAALIWKVGAASRLRMGVDVFAGDPYGLFGQYGNRDRVYAEYRYSF